MRGRKEGKGERVEEGGVGKVVERKSEGGGGRKQVLLCKVMSMRVTCCTHLNFSRVRLHVRPLHSTTAASHFCLCSLSLMRSAEVE